MRDLSDGARRAVGAWLFVSALLVAAMVVLGGYTRLTGSGLSIVEWRPVTGLLPPLSEAAWAEAFRGYRASPEYRVVNAGMTLEGFRGIFWLEYLHRLLGRLIGAVFLLPLVSFAVTRRIPKALATRLAFIFLLGALQGVVGWLMVKSGLVDVPAVSPHRLTLHLGLALVIFALLLWTALDVVRAEASARDRTSRVGALLVGLVLLSAASGAYVAGNHAGLVFNTFPLMEGGLLPPGVLALKPVWRNFFENAGTVQFQHRVLTVLTVATTIVCALRWRRQAGRAAWLLLTMALVQPTLGILTLLHHVPLNLAAAHQSGAVLLLSSAVWFAHRVRSPAVVKSH